MESRLRIVIVDDHPVVREGIRMCLQAWRELDIVAEARDGDEAVEQVRTAQPDVVLLDLTMPRVSGLEALPRIRRAADKARVIVLTVHNTSEYVRQAIAARVDGYLLKDTAPQEYVEAIHAVAGGKFFISRGVAQYMKGESPRPNHERFGLTPREYEYLVAAARGGKLADIALRLGCSPGTVKTYRKRVYRKLGLQNAAGLAKFGLFHNL